MTAKVGGLWDSLLGEGRRFWAFVNSDFHSATFGRNQTHLVENGVR